MSKEFKYIAKIMFKNKILQYTGQQFEDFFVEIMSCSNCNFQPVKAHGNIGDKKNDGFDKTTNTYYQVYAPEDITNKKTVDDGVKKIENDFLGLYKHWNNVHSIKKYYFVLNDKYKGLPAPMHQKLLELSSTYSDISFDFLLARNLENMFDNLSIDQKQSIVGFIPDAHLPLIEYTALNETIEHLMNIDVNFQKTEVLIAPDFDDKIHFNNLSLCVSQYLTSGSYQTGLLNQYFNENRGIKDIIQSKFITLYEESKIDIPDTLNNFSDNRFFYILDKACTKNTLAIKNSVLILMAYYFSMCDIFEEPNVSILVKEK